MSLQENATSLLYNGLIEELVDVLELNDNKLIVNNFIKDSIYLIMMVHQRGCVVVV
jgi:hypothetical protein